MCKWRCKICGYTHEGDEPPEACPWCGAPKTEFIQLECPLCGAPKKVEVPPAAMDSRDEEKIKAALNLGFAANRRYSYQMNHLDNPRLNCILAGAMRAEEEQLGRALAQLRKTHAQAKPGFATTLLYLKLNLEAEEAALQIIKGYTAETGDGALKGLFTAMAKSRAGRVNLFRSLIREIEEGSFPVLFHCPVCGWEISYGVHARVGQVERCDKCGAKFELLLVEGDFKLAPVS